MKHDSRAAAPALLAAALLLLGGALSAQETGGVTPAEGSVRRGKAPVAKNLLRVRFPRPKSFTLANGLRVFVLEDRKFPAVRLSLSLLAGSLFEPKPGVADLTASMLTEGTKRRGYVTLAGTVEEMGASLSASAGTETATLSLSGLSETAPAVLELLAEILLEPAFPAARMDRLKFQQTAQAGQRRTNPASLISDISGKVYYGKTPYGRPAAGPGEIAALTPADLADFHGRYYRPNGAILGISGDVETRDLRERLESLLSNWQPGPTTPDLPPAEFSPKEATRIFLIDRPGSAQTVLQFGNLAVRRDDPDYIPLVVANRILGGGSSGRLFQNIREQKGFTYGAYSNLGGGRWPGIWGASASVRTPVTEPAVREFLHEFNRLQDEPVPPEVLERAKRSLVGSFALTLETPQGVLGRTLDLVQDGLPLDYWDTYPDRIQAVTAADVQRVARRYLGKGRIQLFAVGERSRIEEGLRRLGPVEIVEAAQLPGGEAGRGGRRR